MQINNGIKINEVMKEMENLYIRKDFGKLKEIFINEKETGERRTVANYYLQIPDNMQVKKILIYILTFYNNKRQEESCLFTNYKIIILVA